MTTMLEQLTTAQVATTLVPSVTYNLLSEPKSINVTVIVSRSSDSDHPLHFTAPVIGVPGSGSPDIAVTWNVIWTLLPGSGLDSVKFIDPGLQTPALDSVLPEGVNPISPLQVEGHHDMMQALINHTALSVRSFNYRMFVQGQQGANIMPDTRDPTIVVTLDPMT
jgi:hypothetical protein